MIAMSGQRLQPFPAPTRWITDAIQFLVGGFMLTQAILKSLFHYDPETGVFTRLVNVGNVKAGSSAGHRHSRGYLQIGISNNHYLSHRLAWLYMTGDWPVGVDHKNRIKTDNRFSNLREATQVQNLQNGSVHSDSISGLLGVSWHKQSKKWLARIYVDGTRHYLGAFCDKESASEAYMNAKSLLHPFAPPPAGTTTTVTQKTVDTQETK